MAHKNSNNFNESKKALFILSAFVSLWLSTIDNSFGIEPDKLGKLHLHPYDIAAPAEIIIPPELTLGAGRTLTCSTCHGISGIREKALSDVKRDSDNFLKGGPYTELTDFCYRCHKKEEYKRDNIHKMKDKKGALIKDNCLFCHMKTPDPAKVKNMDELKFRLPPEKLCLSCHLKTPHINAVNHLKKPEKEMKEFMAASEKKMNIILPLSAEGKIMCVTCHAPHENGVISEKRPAGTQVEDRDVAEGIEYIESDWGEIFAEDKKGRLLKLSKKRGKEFALKYMKIKSELLLRLSAKDGTLCMACHSLKGRKR